MKKSLASVIIGLMVVALYCTSAAADIKQLKVYKGVLAHTTSMTPTHCGQTTSKSSKSSLRPLLLRLLFVHMAAPNTPRLHDRVYKS